MGRIRRIRNLVSLASSQGPIRGCDRALSLAYLSMNHDYPPGINGPSTPGGSEPQPVCIRSLVLHLSCASGPCLGEQWRSNKLFLSFSARDRSARPESETREISPLASRFYRAAAAHDTMVLFRRVRQLKCTLASRLVDDTAHITRRSTIQLIHTHAPCGLCLTEKGFAVFPAPVRLWGSKLVRPSRVSGAR